MSTPLTEAITIRADLGGGAEGWLVVDTTYRDASSGGLRIAEDLTLDEVAALAREMTLKFAFIGRRSGGAKSGIKLAPGAGPAERTRVLAELGRQLGPILRRGVYCPGTDMGCSGADLVAVFRGAGLRIGRPTDTAVFTAIGARDALAACREALGITARPVRIGVEGFGAVAAALVERLPPREYAITALSTVVGAVFDERGFDPTALVAARRRHGDALVEHLDGDRGPREDLFGSDVDVLVPSARTWSVSAERARAVRARLVAPVANAPYARGALEVLEAKGTICLPGFVVNCGGVFASSLHDSGVPLSSVERLSRRQFRAIVAALLDARAEWGASPVRLAEEIALERLAERQASTRPESRLRRLARAVASEYVPRRLYGHDYLARFARNLADLETTVRTRGERTTQARQPETAEPPSRAAGEARRGRAWI
jgi:glutamate dehydrogenase (NAD(P)+)